MKLFIALTSMVLAVYCAPSERNDKSGDFGWLSDNVVLRESHEATTLSVGYSQGYGPELTLKVVVQDGTAKELLDYSVSPKFITIGEKTAEVEVRALLDGLAMEGNEYFTIALEPVGSPLPTVSFNCNLVQPVTLIDSDMDDLELTFTNDDYRASESEGKLSVILNKNKRLALPLAVIITPGTVEQAMSWENVTLPRIPADIVTYEILQSTNRASVEPSSMRDFNDSSIVVEFLADEDQPNNDVVVSIAVVDDELNEVTDEYFLVRFDVLEIEEAIKIGTQAALCQIVDDDVMRIGFPQASYILPRKDSIVQHSIQILSENNRTSQQPFLFDILVLCLIFIPLI